MNIEIVDKMYNALCSFDKIYLESRVECNNENKIYLAYVNQRFEIYVETNIFSGWYMGNYDSSLYTSCFFQEEKNMLTRYCLSAEKLSRYKSVNNKKHCQISIKKQENINLSINYFWLIEKCKKIIKKFVNNDNSIKFFMNISVKDMESFYFNNCKNFILQHPVQTLYFEIQIRGAKGVNETLIIKNSTPQQIEEALSNKFEYIKKTYYRKETSKSLKKLNGIPIVICNEAVGLLVHELFGHPSEIDIGNRENSENTEALKWLNLFDNAIYDNSIIYKYDDYGNQCKKNFLIEEGKRKTYIDGRRNSKIYSSNARAENFQHAPITRMSNTYLESGSLCEDLFKSIEKECLIVEKIYNTVSLYQGQMLIPVKVGFINNNTIKEEMVKNFFIKVDSKYLQQIKLFKKVRISNLWCIKERQEIIVGAGGPNIYVEGGVISCE